MIAAGLVLLAVGAVDLVREFTPLRRRWIGLVAVALLVLAIGALADAIIPALLALAVATTWVWLSPTGITTRLGMWPIAGLLVVCAALTVIVPVRVDPGVIGLLGPIASPVGPLTFDHIVLLAGAAAYLLESANVVVRTALVHGRVPVAAISRDAAAAFDTGAVDNDEERRDASPAAVSSGFDDPDADVDADARADDVTTVTPPPTVPLAPALKGGRLIGPLERLLVLGLTLSGMYALVAAILAAKGIVRFPEISRDSRDGNRAEYFLIGSLVSWTQALTAALLIWWSFGTTLP